MNRPGHVCFGERTGHVIPDMFVLKGLDTLHSITTVKTIISGFLATGKSYKNSNLAKCCFYSRYILPIKYSIRWTKSLSIIS